MKLALQQNLGIQIERLNPELQDYTIAQALANYTPIFGGGVNYTNQDQPPSSFLSGSDDTITSTNFGGNAQLAEALPVRHQRDRVVGQLPLDDQQQFSAASTRS